MSGVVAPNFYGGTAFYDAVTSGQTSFKDATYTNALARMLELRPYMHPNFMGVDYTTMQQQFINEQAAMFIGGSWGIGFFKAPKKGLDFDIFLAPPSTNRTPPRVSSYNYRHYGAKAHTPNTDAPLEFIQIPATTAVRPALP